MIRTIRPTRRFGLAALLVLTLAGFTAATGRIDFGAWLAAQSRDAGFVLESLELNGLNRTDRSALLASLNMDLGMPMMSIELETVKAAVEALPWVKAARIERHLPGTLKVRVEERAPYALWQRDGEVHLIDADGVVIPGQSLRQYHDRTLFVGRGANLAAARLKADMSEFSELTDQLESAVRVGERRWDLIFTGGVRVKFPEVMPGQGLKSNLRKFANLNRAHRLLERDVTVIDLRVPGQLVLRVGKDARKRLAKNLDET